MNKTFIRRRFDIVYEIYTGFYSIDVNATMMCIFTIIMLLPFPMMNKLTIVGITLKGVFYDSDNKDILNTQRLLKADLMAYGMSWVIVFLVKTGY